MPMLGRPIFFAGSQLPARWCNAAHFVILDTHFDAGLNFLGTWAAWRADPAQARQLHYLALVERAFSLADLRQACADIPEVSILLETLAEVLPPLLPGFHRIFLDDDRVVLTLICGDVPAGLSQLNARIDAFFLDGCMDGSVPKLLGRLAAPQATLVCEDLLQDVRRNLEQAGFVTDHTAIQLNRHNAFCARYAPRWPLPPLPSVPERAAIIIGAGLAGSAACERLAARGWQLTLIERHAQPAQEASGNLAGIYMPLLSKDDNATARLTRAAYLFAAQMWRRIGGIGRAFPGEACGVLHIARDAEHAWMQQQMLQHFQFPSAFVQWLDSVAAGKLLGNPVANGAWFFPQAGWAHPAGVCRALLANCASQIEVRYSQSAMQLARVGDRWQVLDASGTCIAQAPVVVLANGVDALRFAQAQHLPLTSVRGQVTHVPAQALPDLPVVVCRDGYITRSSQGFCSIGASYDLDADTAPRHSSDVENCARVNQMLPNLSLQLDSIDYQSRVAFRCVASDRLPLVGALPDMAAEFRGERLRDVPRLPGLYGLLGYASRGLIWSSLAAELLAAQLEGEPLPLENDLVAALDPARFMLKQVRKNH